MPEVVRRANTAKSKSALVPWRVVNHEQIALPHFLILATLASNSS
jgi:hypothetical protein